MELKRKNPVGIQIKWKSWKQDKWF